jgi:hypothetical protein
MTERAPENLVVPSAEANKPATGPEAAPKLDGHDAKVDFLGVDELVAGAGRQRCAMLPGLELVIVIGALDGREPSAAGKESRVVHRKHRVVVGRFPVFGLVDVAAPHAPAVSRVFGPNVQCR